MRVAWRVVGLCLVVIGIARIAATWGVFNETWDEGVHIAAGTEWLQRGTYTYDPAHPPLARVAAALGPWLAGVRVQDAASAGPDAHQVLHAGGHYWRNLALARAGILPFFVLACAAVWCWARELGGDLAAASALLVFTTLPPVLAHAGLATTDMALTATLPWAALALRRWLRAPGAMRGALLGLAAGAAILSKLSALAYLPAIALAVALLQPRARNGAWPGGASAALALAVVLLVVWAGYRFDTGAALAPAGANVPDQGAWPGLARTLLGAAWLPAPALVHGVLQLSQKFHGGHLSYLMGEISTTGWWYFFPVALAVKTPLPALALFAVGAAAAGRTRAGWLPIASALAVLAVGMLAGLNIGLRHVLPLYAFAAIAAGCGCAWLASRTRMPRAAAATLGGLLAAQVVTSAASHPDYLAYFNPVAGAHPEQVLVDSDLDWGQDLVRLGAELRARGVQRVSLCYSGTMDPRDAGLPAVADLRRYQPVSGWVAISLMCQTLGRFVAPYDGYRWLQQYEPVPWAGRSIRLYRLPQTGRDDAP